MIAEVAEKLTQHEKWIEKNPLRIFRKENNLSLRRMAGLIGVQVNTIQSWEFGGATPNDENFARLEKFIPEIRNLWHEWLKSRTT